MARFRCNSFVETTCIPKRKLQEHITRIPPRGGRGGGGVPDIGLIIRLAVVPCISEEEAFPIYIVWVSL